MNSVARQVCMAVTASLLLAGVGLAFMDWWKPDHSQDDATKADWEDLGQRISRIQEEMASRESLVEGQLAGLSEATSSPPSSSPLHALVEEQKLELERLRAELADSKQAAQKVQVAESERAADLAREEEVKKLRDELEMTRGQLTDAEEEAKRLRELQDNTPDLEGTKLQAGEGADERQLADRGAACVALVREGERLEMELTEQKQNEHQMWRKWREYQDRQRLVEYLDELDQKLTSLNVTIRNLPKIKEIVKAEYPKPDPHPEAFAPMLDYYMFGTVFPNRTERQREVWNEEMERMGKAKDDAEAASQKLEAAIVDLERKFNDTCLPKRGTHLLQPALPPRLTSDVSPRGNLSARERKIRIGKAAPLMGRHAWALDPLLFPHRINVSFILQYFKKPDNLAIITDRLFQCTNGRKGGGKVAGVKSELIVNVDNPDEHNLWIEVWNRTDDFLIPIFSHNQHELRGYNHGAGVATGDILVMLQDDLIPSEDCSWLDRMVQIFNSWPRVACVGLNFGCFDCTNRDEPVARRRFSGWEDGILYRDKKTGIKMQFAGQVDIGPMAFDARAYREVGGFNEALSNPGESGIFLDYDISTRLWLAGYQVVHMAMPIFFDNGGEASTHNPLTLGGIYRNINQGLNGNYYGYAFDRYVQIVWKEVKKLNELLEKLDTWKQEDGL